MFIQNNPNQGEKNGILQRQTEKECRCGKDGFVEISGTIIRKAIVDKTKLSEIYMQKEILEELQKLDNAFIS